MKATWKDAVLAESNDTVVVEGNHYFPPDSVKKEYLQPSSSHTICPWKGEASYYNLAYLQQYVFKHVVGWTKLFEAKSQ